MWIRLRLNNIFNFNFVCDLLECYLVMNFSFKL